MSQDVEIGDYVEFETGGGYISCPVCGELLVTEHADLPDDDEITCEGCGAVFSCGVSHYWSGRLLRIEKEGEQP